MLHSGEAATLERTRTATCIFESFGSKLTGVDEELIGHSGVIHVMDGAGKQGCEDLQVRENSLERGQRREDELLSIRSEDDRRDLCVGGLEPGTNLQSRRGQ